MTKLTGVALGLWLATCVAFLPTSSAQAQDAAATAETNAQSDNAQPSAQGGENLAAEPAGAEEILITGSRIKRKSIATAAPVTVVNKEDLLASGKTTIAEILQRLPVNANAINIQFNNGGNGASRVNLRSLGAERTLVLVNGRRHVPGGDGVDSSVDLNAIPVSIIERVEILKDGASAVYGSDAIAGVVNIITRRDFSGVEANAYTSISQRGDARVLQLDFTAGSSSEKGNIVFSGMYFDQQPVFAGDREFSEIARSFDFQGFVDAGRPSNEEPFIDNSGSVGTPQGTILDTSGAPGNAAWDATGCSGGLCFNDPVGGWRPFAFPQDTYNFQPENYLLTPSRRLNFWSQGNYELSDYFNVFFEAGFTNRVSEQLLAPTPLFLSSENIILSAQNRFNPFGRDFNWVGRRMLEAGNRVFAQDSNTFRLVAGIEGTIPDIGPLVDWRWDAHFNVGRTETTNVVGGRFNRSNVARALGPDSGCTGDCVALDVLSGAGNISQDMIDYIAFDGIDRGFTEQNVFELNVSGPLYELVDGNPIALAFGYQYRKEIGSDTPNPLTASGDSTGNKRDPVSGEYDVNAGYIELSVPLIANVPGAKSLEFNAAGRFVNFNTFGSNLAYKFGLRWQPIDYFALRGTYSTAFRAPSVNELFTGALDSFPNVSDPCSSVPGVGQLNDDVVAANCALDNLADGVADPSVQLRSQEGGNTELEPETATIITGGLVLEDSLIKGLTASIDYYNIEIEDAIQEVGAGVILESCYNSPNRNFCDLIQRNADGFIVNIIDLQNNVGGFKAQGIDFNIRYSTPSPFGRIGAGLEGTYLIKLSQIQANGFEQDYVGNYDQASGSNPGANPEYRLNWYLRWAYEFLNAGANFRFIPGFEECEGACSVQDASATPPSRDVKPYFYMDLFAGVNFDSPLGDTALTLGINNVTDATPPFIANGFLAESDAATYDYIGRQFYARLTQTF